MRISVATPDCVSRLESVEGDWVYADDDLEMFRLTRDALKKSHPLVSAEIFQQSALDLQAPFVRWVDECMSAAPRNYWLSTPLSKNPFESHLFLHLVWMVLIERAARQGKNEIIVVTESLGLALALAELCRTRRWQCQCYGKISHRWRYGHRNLLALAKWFGKLSLLGYRVAVARRLFTKEEVANRFVAVELLLETYILDGDMGEDGGCKDRYFPGLMAYYRAQGIKAGYFPLLHRIPFRRLKATYAAMKRSEIPFAPFEAFLTFRDVALSAWTSLRHGLSFSLQTPLHFQGIPVTPLVRAERFVAGLRGAIPLALARAPRRMAEAGIRPTWFIDWFENQALDKGVVLGLKEGLPECHPIAVRQYVSLSNVSSLLTSSGEAIAGVAPTENWSCGGALVAQDARFDAVGSYFAVPALRYAYLHRNAPSNGEGDALLVLLTHSADESLAILDFVVALLQEKGAGDSRVVIKPHPTMEMDAFRQKAERRFPHLITNVIEWENGALRGLLQTAKAVVTSGSGTAVEAICSGVPVVLIGRQAGLNFNSTEGVDPRMWVIAYTPNDLREAITQRFCEKSLPMAERLAIAESSRQAFFMGTDDHEMRRFLPTRQTALPG